MDQLEFIARAIQDQDFRDRLKANPEQVIQESGSGDLEGVQIKVVENTANTFYVAMPSNPNALIDDGSLEKVAGGGWTPRSNSLSSEGTVLSTVSSANSMSKMQDKNTGSS